MVISYWHVEQSDKAGEILKILFDDGGKNVSVLAIYDSIYFSIELRHVKGEPLR